MSVEDDEDETLPGRVALVSKEAETGRFRPMGSRYEAVSEAEAAEFGHALLNRIRGEPLTLSQRELLARTQEAAPSPRAPGPVVEQDELLLALPRGDEAQVRISLRRFRGSSLFLDLRRWEIRADGSWRPTRSGVTLRARELGRVSSALVAILKRVTEDTPGDPGRD